MALALVACELDVDVNRNEVELSDLAIECINETMITNNTSGNKPFTKHTYLCRGSISGFNGACYIRVLHDNFIVHNNHELTIAGEKMPFEFTFAPEWEYLDNPYNTFAIEVYDGDDGDPLCKTTVVVTKHSEGTTSESINIPYMEYSLWGTRCEWQLPRVDNNVIVVNSDEELARYVASDSEEGYPAVDFERYTMIIAHGGAPQGIFDVKVESLQQSSDTEYALNIDVVITMTDAPELWTKALLVDKWDKLYNINLNVDMIELIN